MKLLTAVAAGMAVCAFYAILRAEATNRRRLLRHFRCWLCKHSTAYLVSDRTRHCDCSFCGITNKLLPGALVGELPDIRVSLA
jgi:hypothetical protein